MSRSQVHTPKSRSTMPSPQTPQGPSSSTSPLLQHIHQTPTYHTSPTAIADAELTEEELEEYERGIISWSRAKRFDFWFRKEWFWGYVGGAVLIVLITLMSVFHHRIVQRLMPFIQEVRGWKGGWAIPIGLLIVLSFPPLFGTEIIMLLVGVVWGLEYGIAIVSAGMIMGESLVYAMFKHCCRGRAEHMTRKSLNYACLSEAIVEGGFPMALVVRLSIIPTHFTTAVFAICGLPFLAALILGLPKQIIAVYAGTLLAQEHATNSSRAISITVFVVGAIMTVLALRFIYKRMTGVRKKVLLSMRDDLLSKGIVNPGEPDDEEAGSV